MSELFEMGRLEVRSVQEKILHTAAVVREFNV
jgi:hypothetical protein